MRQSGELSLVHGWTTCHQKDDIVSHQTEYSVEVARLAGGLPRLHERSDLLFVTEHRHFRDVTPNVSRSPARASALAGAGLWIGRLYRNFYVIDAAGRLGNRCAIFAKPGDMKLDCLAKN
jgi:hypothetical protein